MFYLVPFSHSGPVCYLSCAVLLFYSIQFCYLLPCIEYLFYFILLHSSIFFYLICYCSIGIPCFLFLYCSALCIITLLFPLIFYCCILFLPMLLLHCFIWFLSITRFISSVLSSVEANVLVISIFYGQKNNLIVPIKVESRA